MPVLILCPCIFRGQSLSFTFGLMIDSKLPKRVRLSILLLRMARAVSALVLVISLLPPIWQPHLVIVESIALALIGFAISFVRKGSTKALIFLVVLVLLKTPDAVRFPWHVSRYLGGMSVISWISLPTLNVVGYSLTVVAVYLLLSGGSRLWFTRQAKDVQLTSEPEQDAGGELPPRLSGRSWASIRRRRSLSTLRLRRRSLSFALGVASCLQQA